MRRINACLNDKLTKIGERTLQLEALHEKVMLHLPQELQAHCRVGSFNQGQLVLVVDAAVWASELRYQLPTLRDQLRSDGIYQLVSIKLQVATETASSNVPERPPKISRLSQQAKLALLKASQQCQYEPLKQLFFKWSQSD